MVNRWKDEVPGTRWFRADLHVHTLDDEPGNNTVRPNGIEGVLGVDLLGRYARTVLDAAIAADVRILALTPHAVRYREGELSAVWSIVETWRNETAPSGRRYVDEVFAVFPGFEPSFDDGNNGFHLQFIFDASIGKAKFLKAFDLVMEGVAPYRAKNSELVVSSIGAKEALGRLETFHQREQDQDAWDYEILAPHVDSPKGLFKAKGTSVRDLFDCSKLLGLELSDNKLPSEILQNAPTEFHAALKRHQLQYYHSSDAYRVEPGKPQFPIGNRVTWLKLGAPTISGLRQAFLGHESRLRIAYVRDASGALVEHSDISPTASNRRWLRRITISGGAGFFAGKEKTETFEFSPDLTCIIGGSMSGKSTLLNGIRGAFNIDGPATSSNRRPTRGFWEGDPTIQVDPEAWNDVSELSQLPIFFGQGELRAVVDNQVALRELLFRLAPDGGETLERLSEELSAADKTLKALAADHRRLSDAAAAAQIKLDEAIAAANHLSALKAAGYETYEATSQRAVEAESLTKSIAAFRGALTALTDDLSLPMPSAALHAAEPRVGALAADLEKVRESLQGLANTTLGAESTAREVEHTFAARAREARATLETSLVDRGEDPSAFKKLRQYAGTARYLESFQAEAKKANEAKQVVWTKFESVFLERKKLEKTLREEVKTVASRAADATKGRIRVVIRENADFEALDAYIRAAKLSPITKWWNSRIEQGKIPKPTDLSSLIGASDNAEEKFANFGISPALMPAFREAFPDSRRLEMAALRSPDRYEIESQIDGGYRPLAELSGGERISVLLTLLLSSNDSRPLFIDQPEDELDNRRIVSEILPALRALKGKRQVVLVTHNANFVVNGDADQIIQLVADAHHGRVEVMGSIDEPAVRKAIVETVDGGREAFELRKAKYGY